MDRTAVPENVNHPAKDAAAPPRTVKKLKRVETCNFSTGSPRMDFSD
jgi:hypothetical protein